MAAEETEREGLDKEAKWSETDHLYKGMAKNCL